MRLMAITSILAASSLGALALPASAGPCPFPMVQVCKEPGGPPGALPPACKCEYPPGMAPSGKKTTSSGKSEQHKTNVPTVRPNRTPGPND
jgi:hypothetical protein